LGIIEVLFTFLQYIIKKGWFMVNKIVAIISLLVIFFITSCTRPQKFISSQNVNIHGNVASTEGVFLSGVNIAVVEINNKQDEKYTILSDEDGNYIYRLIGSIKTDTLPGSKNLDSYKEQVKLEFSKDGYKTVEKEFKVNKEDLIDYYIDKKKIGNPWDKQCNVTLEKE